MRSAIYAPIYGDYGEDPMRLITLAEAAENAGYDGFFIWDHLALEPDGQLEIVDATIILGALAAATSTIKLGPLITPLARRRPWKVSKEVATLDRLSNGRLVFGVGLGEPAELEFGAFGEDTSGRGRAERLDEGLDLLDQFLSGKAVTYHGKHYTISNASLMPPPLQQPRPPIWIAASLPARAGLRRAVKWDGCFPVKVPKSIVAGEVTSVPWDQWWVSPQDFADVVATIKQSRGELDNYALVATGLTEHDDRNTANAKLAAYAAAGATWWLEWIDDSVGSFERTLEFVRRGPALRA